MVEQEAVRAVGLARRAGRLSVSLYAKAMEACTADGEWEPALRLLEVPQTITEEGRTDKRR